ncbi:MAG TPA: TetR/AcrR family transcriptional regulator [Streptosporangiaceae bacterium]
MPNVRRPGLRERKKAKTRAAIRRHALRLFRKQGYERTTVEQIADAAEISPATFYRYFPTKEDVVLQDDLDLLTIEALEAQPASLPPIAALRAALRASASSLSPEELARFHETSVLSLSVPEIRARALDEFIRSIQVMTQALARRVGRDPEDPAVANLAGAVVGVIMTAALASVGGAGQGEDLLARIDAGLAHLEAGLPL